MTERWQCGDQTWDIELRLGAGGSAQVAYAGQTYLLEDVTLDAAELRFVLDGKLFRFELLDTATQLEITDGVSYYRFQPHTEGAAAASEPQETSASLVSKMPGRVLAINAEPGKLVQKGELLLILEAMKMEHEITAPAAGRVRAYPRQPGDRVMPGDLLADFEPAS